MKEAKIQFSPAEMELMCSAQVILTKNKALQKVKELMEEVQEEMLEYSSNFHFDVFQVSPKISKGENYLGLPYLVLDYPRNFASDNTFAIRTMFWWGNFFSTTIYLSGDYKRIYELKLINYYNTLANENFYLGINEDPWVHHFGEDNFILLKDIGEKSFWEQVQGKKHLKLAKKMALEDWPQLQEKLSKNWKLLVESCFS